MLFHGSNMMELGESVLNLRDGDEKIRITKIIGGVNKL